MANIFNRSSKRKIETSVHNLSHTHSNTWYPGIIYPVMCTKVVPGDTFQIASSPFIRSQPFVAPLMTNVHCDIRYFYCRNLLLWENFDKYITNAQKYGRGYLTGQDVPVHPYFSFYTDDLSDPEFFDSLYGIVDPNQSHGFYVDGIDALPARMYNLIFNEYYYNENYSKQAGVSFGDGLETSDNFMLRKGCWKKDYFTSALPSPQRGDTVNLEALVNFNGNPSQSWVDSDGHALDVYVGGSDAKFNRNSADDGVSLYVDSAEDQEAFLDPGDSFGVNIDIRDLRKASAVQRFLERSAVNGNRYAEYMLAHFGVKTPDNSSFRPQYLGGGSQVINFSPVEQNSSTDATSPQGTLAGKGVLSGVMGMNHRYFFTEYGWIMALMVIRPEATYAGGVNRQFWVGEDRLDTYYNPAFQNIGMQSIKRKELALQLYDNVADADILNNEDIAYQERYMEYKSIPSSVHGKFLTDMDQWVSVRDFIGVAGVNVNQDFMEVQSNVFDNNTAVAEYPPFFGSIRHNIIARRPMQYHAKYGGSL